MSELAPSTSPGPVGPGEAGTPSGLSIASMVTGISGVLLSLGGLGLLPALAAVITGHMARTRNPGARPFWLTGLITGYVGLALSVIVGLIVIVAFGAFFLTISGTLGRYY